MQPFDALTIRAVLQEARPLLTNRKVDKVQQLARDEIVITLRSRTGLSNLLLSAHASFGRLCLVNYPNVPKKPNLPNFCLLLRKHLTGATLLGVEQMQGERIVDFVFSCVDEVGVASYKVLTAEIMGRHSNLIFWDKETQKVVAASHVVTSEMSRQREVAPGLPYVRPPKQERLNIFKMKEAEFNQLYQDHRNAEAAIPLEQWLLTTFAGLGRHLADELVSAAVIDARQSGHDDAVRQSLWNRILPLQSMNEFKPAMRIDLSRYTVLSWLVDAHDSQWKSFPSVNDMIEEYFRAQEVQERFQQLRDRLEAELRSQSDKLHSRLQSATENVSAGERKDEFKKFGDLILANMSLINPGQTELCCEDIYAADGSTVRIPLSASLTAAQNSQNYYRQFAKARARRNAATAAEADARSRLSTIENQTRVLHDAKTAEDLESLRESLLGKHLRAEAPKAAELQKKRSKPRLLSLVSSDGWTIYVGRNRQENDELITRVAQPQDLWMHLVGQSGAHVLIKVPSTKQDPPANTLKEAAQVAARLSKGVAGGKVRVVYTQCRYVRKIAKAKPGVVRYENEKTLEVDTSTPMPPPLKKLFAARNDHR